MTEPSSSTGDPAGAPLTGGAPAGVGGEPPAGWDALQGVPRGDDVFQTLSDRHHGKVRRFLRSHPVVMDVAVCAAYLALSLLALIFTVESPSALWILLGVIAITAALFFRRRFPFSVLGVVSAIEILIMLLGLPAGFHGVAIWFALYAVARAYATARVYAVAFIVTLLEGVGLLVWYARMGALEEMAKQTDASIVPILMGLVVGSYFATNAAVVFFGAWVRNQRLHEAELEGWARRAQDLARGRERNRIAGEMHDIVAHSLSVMIALSDGARRVAEKDPERAKAVMGDVSRTGRAALADLRRSLGVLREETEGAPLGPAGAGADLDEMLDGFRATGLPLRLDRDGLLPEDPALRLTTVRIVQESLTNALRYAKSPTEVLVWLRADARGVHLRVRDDGRNAARRPRSQGSGIGLSGMVERARLFGGTVTAGPLESGGWGVEAWLPAPGQAPQPGRDSNDHHRAQRGAEEKP